MKQNGLIIDVDSFIKNYNEKNPKLKQLTRTSLAKELGMNKQIFTDWKAGKTPKIIYRLFKMMEIGKCDINGIVTKIKNDEKIDNK